MIDPNEIMNAITTNSAKVKPSLDDITDEIYLVIQGYRYEGSRTVSVHKTVDGAIKAARAIINAEHEDEDEASEIVNNVSWYKPSNYVESYNSDTSVIKSWEKNYEYIFVKKILLLN